MAEDWFKDKFIAFVDILGFKNLVDTAEVNAGLSLAQLRAFCSALDNPDDRAAIVRYGPTICPESACIRRDLDFQATQVSDCVVLSAEVSPAGAINLVSHCWRAAMRLLTEGIMVRGYMTRGPIFHESNTFMGTGYHKALKKERDVTAFKKEADERGTPFIEVDPEVCDYVRDCGDACVQEMFSRMVEGDKTVTAIFPFKRLSHSFGIGLGAKFDPAKEKESNQIMREWIQRFQDRVMSFVDESKPEAVNKARHYIRALDRQLAVCDETDEMIDRLCAPFLSHGLSDLKGHSE